MSKIKKILPIESKVPNHEGLCTPIWLNNNRLYNRIDGGTTGFFRKIKYFMGILPYKTGKEFHGVINQGIVEEFRRL